MRPHLEGSKCKTGSRKGAYGRHWLPSSLEYSSMLTSLVAGVARAAGRALLPAGCLSWCDRFPSFQPHWTQRKQLLGELPPPPVLVQTNLIIDAVGMSQGREGAWVTYLGSYKRAVWAQTRDGMLA